MRACMEREDIHSQWSDPKENFQHVMYKDGFFAAVDVVHLFQVNMRHTMSKPVFGISDQVRHKPGSTATEDG